MPRAVARSGKGDGVRRVPGLADAWREAQDDEDLWQLPALAAEAQRRTQAAPYASALEAGPAVKSSERIALLIRDLETVSVHQMLSPGQTDVFDDPVVQALSKAGDDDVEPLLKCLREDDRLTRSRYTEGLSSAGPIIPVYEAAYTALFGILKKKFPVYEGDPGDPYRKRDIRHLSREERQALAAKIEAAWQQRRGVAPEDWAYRTLQDDKAGARAWFQAVDDIVQPADGTFTIYRLVRPVAGSYSYRMDPGPFTPRGESLRRRTDPSVTGLMIRRFKQAVREPADHHFDGVINLDTLGNFLLALAGWDGEHCLAELRTMQRELATRSPRLTSNFHGAVLVPLYEKRLELGDRSALEDYAAYLEALQPGELATDTDGAASYFQLMWRHADEPVMRRAAAKLFGGQGSPWVPLIDEEGKRQLGVSRLFRTPLVGMSEFRVELERGLGDTRKAGEVTLAASGMYYGLPDGSSHSYAGDPLAKGGTTVNYRVCDAYAYLLARLDGFPRCEPYWPLAERDRAVAACREFLRRYGENFRYQPGDHNPQNAFPSAAPIHFARLDHPATEEDVASGRAIFSLAGEVRTCRLPTLPLTAWRPGHKADPVPGTSVDEDGTQEDVISYETQGKVWQAEEVLVDGKWQRFYGFVGRYQLEKVPAAEIEFGQNGTGESGYERVTAEISGRLEGPIDHGSYPDFNMAFSQRDFVSPDTPLPVKVIVTNHSGLDQPLPAELILPPGAGKAVPPGIRISLSYSEKIPPRVYRYADPDFDYGEWRELPLRSDVQTPGSQKSDVVLGPAQQMTVLNVDLRDLFEITRLGSYKVKILFHVPGQPEGKSNEPIFSVAEPAR